MTQQTVTGYLKLQGIKSASNFFGLCLSLLAVIVACYISFFSKMPITIENPLILVLASSFLLVTFKSYSLDTLQKIVGFYLVGVLTNELSLQYFQISFLPINVRLSYSTVVLFLCAIGYLFERLSLTNTLQPSWRADIYSNWVFALAIIAVHTALLRVATSRFYGYGYERDLSVLGNLCLYFLLFILLRDSFEMPRFRQGTGLIIAFFCIAAIAAEKSL